MKDNKKSVTFFRDTFYSVVYEPIKQPVLQELRIEQDTIEEWYNNQEQPFEHPRTEHYHCMKL